MRTHVLETAFAQSETKIKENGKRNLSTFLLQATNWQMNLAVFV